MENVCICRALRNHTSVKKSREKARVAVGMGLESNLLRVSERSVRAKGRMLSAVFFLTISNLLDTKFKNVCASSVRGGLRSHVPLKCNVALMCTWSGA